MSELEHQVVERAIRGDQGALDAVLRAWGPRAHRLARRLCPANEALDAVQETLLIVATRIGTLRAVEALTSWIFQALKRQCIKSFSRVRRETALVRALGILKPEAPGLQDREALLDELGRVLNNLPPRDRQILLLRDLEDLSIAETARRLALSESAVKSRLHRARGLLREKMLDTPAARTLVSW